jgi:RNA polymerase sigma factor (sigma-70 family)
LPLIRVNTGRSHECATAGLLINTGICVLSIAMAGRDDSNTSLTLLGRLACSPPDQAAWCDFVDRYGPRILQWCRAWALQEADILDVSQAVLTKLAVQMGRFEYDPAGSFRNWLRTLVERAALDLLSARARVVGNGTAQTVQILANLEARDDLVHRLEAEFDLELLEAATRNVLGRVAPKTWEAYDMTARQGCPALDVAVRLGMRVGTVYQAKSSVTRMLQEEVRKLEAGDRTRDAD